jgi:hypothetical protein
MIVSTFVSLARAFSPVLTHKKPVTAALSKRFFMPVHHHQHDDHDGTDLMNQSNNDNNDNNKFDLSTSFPTTKSSATAMMVVSWLATTGMARADSPDWGIFEGRTGSILHPITMGGLFGLSCYTAYLGFQWRRQRTLGDEITALKKQLPPLGSFKTIQEALDSEEMQDQEAKLKAALPIEKEIQDLTAERKELASQGNRDKHYNQGAWIAFLGTVFAIEGPLNTYARAGKLFPGPHLYAGAGLVVCWAAAVACVPYMSKGSETARTLHIASNLTGLALFAWQITSGIPILLKVVELTKWP